MKIAVILLWALVIAGCNTTTLIDPRQTDEFRAFVAKVQSRWEEEIRNAGKYPRPTRVTIWLVPRDGTLVFRDMVGGIEAPQSYAKRAVEHASRTTKFSPFVYDAIVRAKVVKCEFFYVYDGLTRRQSQRPHRHASCYRTYFRNEAANQEPK